MPRPSPLVLATALPPALRRGDFALGTATAAQVAWTMGLWGAPAALGAGLAVAGAWRMRDRIPGLGVLLLTASLGGLAMLLGEWTAAGALASHGGHGSGWLATALASVPMVAVCVGGCAAWCPPPCRSRQRRARLLAHGVLALGMVAGMGLGGAAVPAHASALAHHLAMLAGMVAGTAVGLAALYTADAWRFR